MKTYDVVDLTGDSYLNPVGAEYGDGSGTHQRPVSNITSISVHHDAQPRPHDYDSVARYRAEAATHYNRLGPGLQYHYKIDNTGVIFKIRPHETWLYVVGSAENTSCLAICLDGYLHDDSMGEAQDPTREQGEALYQLLQNLCEQHPEFQATWPNVRPHRDYSSTACCGSRLVDHIYPIQDDASARANLLNQWTYDWPSEQPTSAPVPTPAPAPQPPAPPTVTINYRVKKDGKQIGAYSVDKNAYQKYYDNPGSLIFDQNGQDVTAQLLAKFDPPKPPAPKPEDQDHAEVQALDTRVSKLEALLKKVVDFLASIFIGFKQ